MGIPFLFRYIRRRFPQAIGSSFPTNKTYDCLYIDFNAIIHESVIVDGEDSLCADDDGAEAEANRIIERCTMRLLSLIDSISPASVFIAIDGLAPMAKMHQQRMRRYMSSSSKPPRAWDRNAISPGTAFMRRLSDALHSLDLGQRAVRVSISASDEDGEGEQKIFRHLISSSRGNVLIHGLDADLILMSLLSQRWESIELYRNSHNNINTNKTPTRLDNNNKATTDILNIRTMRNQLVRYLHATTNSSGDATDLVRDFVTLCLLLGNDFIPSVPGLRLKDGGLETLLDEYGRVFRECGNRPMTVGGSDTLSGIRMGFLTALVGALSRAEPSRVAAEDAAYRERCGRLAGVPEHKRLVDDYPCYHPPQDFLRAPLPGWQARYYHTLFGGMSDTKDVRAVCEAFLAGLAWTLKYLGTQEVVSVGWHYPHAYAPSMQDLYNFLCEDEVVCIAAVECNFYNRDTRFARFRNAVARRMHARNTTDECVRLQCYLLLILPPSSIARLIEDSSIMVGEVAAQADFMFPNGFRIQTYAKEKMWECRPILPPLDLSMLANILSTSIPHG